MSRPNTLETLMLRTQRDGECLLWQGAKNRRGYGSVSVQGRIKPAHVAVFELAVGAVPMGLELDHLCRRPSCVNPKHLEPVTHRENVLRGTSPAALHAVKKHCEKGHPYTPENTSLFDGGRRRCRTCINARNRNYMRNYRAQGKDLL